MMLPTSALSLAQLVLSTLSTQSSSDASSSSTLLTSAASTSSSSHRFTPSWLDLPPGNSDDNIRLGASVSACTFAVGPPGPPASALCPAFNAFCTAFKDEYRSHHIRALKTSSPFSSVPFGNPRSAKGKAKAKGDDEDDSNPLKDVAFRTGCTGGATQASDGSYLSGYTATCVVDGVDWIPFVFDSFMRAEFGVKEGEGEGQGPLPIYTSFIGCQVPAHL